MSDETACCRSCVHSKADLTLPMRMLRCGLNPKRPVKFEDSCKEYSYEPGTTDYIGEDQDWLGS